MFWAKLPGPVKASIFLVLTFILGLIVISFSWFYRISSVDVLPDFLIVLLFLFLLVAIISTLMALIAIFIRLKFRWILLFTFLSFLGSGVCFLRFSIMSFTSFIALCIVLINYNDFITRNQQYQKMTNWD